MAKADNRASIAVPIKVVFGHQADPSVEHNSSGSLLILMTVVLHHHLNQITRDPNVRVKLSGSVEEGIGIAKANAVLHLTQDLYEKRGQLYAQLQNSDERIKSVSDRFHYLRVVSSPINELSIIV